MLDFPTDPVLVKLRTDIEALAGSVAHVDETHLPGMRWNCTRVRGGPLDGETGEKGATPFTTICNGRPKPEAARGIQPRPIAKMARFSLTSARKLRKQIPGPALLVWRDFAYEPAGDLWIRLAFEAA